MFQRLLFMVFIFMMPTIFHAQGLDYQILKDLNKLQSPSDNKFQKFISDADAPIVLGIPVAMVGISFLNKDKDLRRKGLEACVAQGLNVATVYLLKEIVKRPRPYLTYTDLKNVTEEGSWSFPSGHTSSAFAFATSMSLSYPKWYVIVPTYTFASAVGFSRMYLNVHYPSDVLVGAILGSASAWVTWKVSKKLQAKKKV
jgi:membrane-associated phospholipid phosphatase